MNTTKVLPHKTNLYKKVYVRLVCLLSSYDRNFSFPRLILLVAILSALSYSFAFGFGFLIDDWNQILGALAYPEMLEGYLRTHPVSVWEFKLLSPIFGFNPLYWQLLGYLLRVLNAISVWFLVATTTKSQRIAFYSTLLFTVFPGGIESVIWASTHSSAIALPFITTGFSFWIKSKESKSWFMYALAILFFLVSILMEPSRSSIIIFISLAWELLMLYQKFTHSNIILFLLRTCILGTLLVVSRYLIALLFRIKIEPQLFLNDMTPKGVEGLIKSFGNLFFGWIFIPPKVGQPLASSLVFWTTVFIFILALIMTIKFIIKKTDNYKLLVFLFLWIIAFFLPNWLTQAPIKSGAHLIVIESRYFALSAIGVVTVVAYFLSSVSKHRAINLLLILLMFNAYSMIKILKKHYSYRSFSFQNQIWDKIESDVPKGEINSVFIYSGTDDARVRVLDWSDSIPFAVRRGVTKKEHFPIVTSDKNLIAKLICEKGISRHSPFGEIIQTEPISLSHIHAWELTDGVLTNKSEYERQQIKTKASCNISDT